MMFIYEVNEMTLHKWRPLFPSEERPEMARLSRYADIPLIIKAVETVRAFKPELADWNGGGEFWLLAMPGTSDVVCCRPGMNPHREGYVVSHVELPWLKGLNKEVAS